MFGPVCLICAGVLTRQRGSRNTVDIADTIINRANAGDASSMAAVSRATSDAVAASDKVLLVKEPP
jgi:predicted ABC-class ATPase